MEIKGLDIKNYREVNGLTQQELATELGVSFRTIQNYEAGGKIPVSKYEILRKMFQGVKLDSNTSIQELVNYVIKNEKKFLENETFKEWVESKISGIQSTEEFIIEIIKDYTDDKFKDINENIMYLLRANMDRMVEDKNTTSKKIG